jgi:hypothetical protein
MKYTAFAIVIVVATVASPAHGQGYGSHLAKTQRARDEDNVDPRLQIYQALLFGSLTVDFQRTPVREVFETMARDLDTNIVVRYLDDRHESGIDPELPITLRLRDMLPLDILELVLEECSVDEPSTWQARDGFLEIGSTARLSVRSARDTRTYPVDDLTFQPPRFDDAPSVGFGVDTRWGGYRSNFGGVHRRSRSSRQPSARNPQQVSGLIDLITSTIEPEAWEQNGGDQATILHRGGSLIVNAPPFIHRQIGGTPRVPPPRTERDR